MSKKILFSFIVFIVLFCLPFYFAKAFTTSSTGYANNGAPETDAYAGTANVLIMDISLPDPISDTTIGGTAPSAGTALVSDEPAGWNLYYYDKTDGDVWDSSNDWVGTDDDADGVYTSAADTVVDCDGSGSANAGSCDAHNPGDTLTATDASDNLCTDSLTSPTCVYIDSGGDCDATDADTHTYLLGSGCGTASDNAVGANWAYVDSDSDEAYDDGEDLYIENVQGELTYSAAADTTIGGTAPSAGTTLSATKDSDWTTMKYYDGPDGSAFNSGVDWIGLDNDSSGYYNGDKISSVVVQNIENALDDDISAIKVWQEEGTTSGFQSSQDTLIGSISSGAKWGQTISTTSAVVWTATSKDRIYITASIASGAINGRIIEAKIPINGLQFVSTNDGPTDNPIVNAYTQTIISGTSGAAVDNTAPSSSITDPADGARLDPGVNYTIQGICSDEGGSSVMQVEISLDGGQTWHLTTPLQATDSGFTWSYLWQSPQEGTYNLKTRATDWVGNTEIPGDGITVEVRALTCSDYTTEEECTSEGCYWYEESCHEKPQALTCSDYTTEEDCVSAGCYWYENACHSEEQPSVEKPIEEMTEEELRERIVELQQQIIQLLQQLIELITQQILQLGGSL